MSAGSLLRPRAIVHILRLTNGRTWPGSEADATKAGTRRSAGHESRAGARMSGLHALSLYESYLLSTDDATWIDSLLRTLENTDFIGLNRSD